MLSQFLKEVVILVVGKQAEPIADLLYSEKHVNEFLIAKKLGITINQTRNILYKIADHGLVSSIRKKDKRKGWYTYFWKLEVLKALEFLRGVLVKRAEQLQYQIRSRETKQFYICELCNVEFNEENALLRDFTCSECGSVFVLKDNEPVLKELRKQLVKLEQTLALVDEEIEKERAKEEKKREKENKKLQKEKKEKRAASAKKALAKRRATKKASGVKASVTKKAAKKKVVKKKSSGAEAKRAAVKKEVTGSKKTKRVAKYPMKKTSAKSRRGSRKK